MAILTRIKTQTNLNPTLKTLTQLMFISLTSWVRWDRLDLKVPALVRTVLKVQILSFNFSDKASQTISKANSLEL